jgi:NAD-dependent SIR2 family protein deacetylase
VDLLADLVSRGGVVVLSGAGISTESGIPDYRGPTGASMRRHAPMTHQSFVRDADARRRYWARSHVGWRIMRTAQPNTGHRAVADLEKAGLVTGVITQNVDGLHQAAGSEQVVDLHGRLDRVMCLHCGSLSTREDIDRRLGQVNAEWRTTVLAHNPDGDVDIPDADLDRFTVVDCLDCGGPLKPDVVYFGDSVPRDRVEESYALVDSASSVLVLGTSLHVYSGRRFVVRAAERGIPVAVVNQGPTRADDDAVVRIDAPLGSTLSTLVARVGTTSTRV